MSRFPKLYGEKRHISSKNKLNLWRRISSNFQKSPKFSKKRPRTLLGVFIRLCLTLAIWGICFIGLALLWFSYDLPDIRQLQVAYRKPSVTIQTQDGTIIGTYGDLCEDLVNVNELPPYVGQAVLAIEDRRFYSHFGVDIIGLARAAYTNYKADRIVQGGSTITQQLAKNFLQSQGLYGPHDRSIRRKIQEVIMSLWLEWHFTKDQILTMYLNRVYFGSGTYGVDAAAQKYFAKSARELTVYEAAVLAGLLKAPSKYSPAYNPKKAKERATVVLTQMVEAGFIRDSQTYLAQADATASQEKEQSIKFFTDWVYENLPNYIGSIDRDLVVVTTLNVAFQKQAEASCLLMINEMGKELKVSEIAMVVMTPDGAIKAMLGGKDYNKSQYNRVTQAQRQPGSAFKLFVYLAALEAGKNLETLIDDSPIQIGNWNPGLYHWKPQGEITLKEAFAHSVNSVTVRLAQELGPAKIVSVARRLGIVSPLSQDLSIALGSKEVNLLELTAAFATFANKFRSVWPYGILEIRDKATAQIMYQHDDGEGLVVVEPDIGQQMLELLYEVINNGTGRAAKLSIPVAGKTGSNGDSDAFFIGFTYDLVAGVWTGNDTRNLMSKKSTGGRLPAKTWAHFMKAILNRGYEQFYDAKQSTDLEQVVSQSAQSFPETPPNTSSDPFETIIKNITNKN
ncbi:MAG: PBP1A family penicillin-binding protein [Proteobacteria bacterium]|nr:PBP1A family penicillin-binding protein [Pseudomonadota bacterium]